MCKRDRHACKRPGGGTKALIVSGKSRHGKELAADIRRILERAGGIEAAIFPGADPNPTDTSVMEGADIYRKENCNMIVAVGGGSLWTVQRQSALWYIMGGEG